MNWFQRAILRLIGGNPNDYAEALAAGKREREALDAEPDYRLTPIPYRCPRASCGSTDVLFGRAVERLVPGVGCPVRIVVGADVVCNRCGQPFCVTRDEVYSPATGPASHPEDNGPRVPEPANARLRWRDRPEP